MGQLQPGFLGGGGGGGGGVCSGHMAGFLSKKSTLDAILRVVQERLRVRHS